jgi:hypothetical protein
MHAAQRKRKPAYRAVALLEILRSGNDDETAAIPTERYAAGRITRRCSASHWGRVAAKQNCVPRGGAVAELSGRGAFGGGDGCLERDAWQGVGPSWRAGEQKLGCAELGF